MGAQGVEQDAWGPTVHATKLQPAFLQRSRAHCSVSKTHLLHPTLLGLDQHAG
jgi:hypothetical protein